MKIRLPTHVLVSNLGNYSLCGTIVLDGTVTKSGGIHIDDNVCNYHFVATGDLDGNQLTLNYSATYGSDTETCSAHMYRQ